MMEVVVSNVQLAGAIDALSAKFDALLNVISSAHPDMVSGDADAGSRAGGQAPPTKVRRTRAKSAYNVHMSEELAKLKVSHPDIGHRKRFAMAVMSWPRSAGSGGEAKGSDASDGAAPEPENDVADEPADDENNAPA